MKERRSPRLSSTSLEGRWLGESLGKLPPQAIDMEESVLGAAIQERQGQLVALEKLSPEDFYLESNKEIFIAIKSLADKGQPIDMRTVVNELKSSGKLELVGGHYYIADLTSKISSAANIEYYCIILIERRIKRDLIQLASLIHKEAYEDTSDALELVDQVAKFPLELYSKIKISGEKHIKDGITQVTLDINKRTENSPDITGVPTGYTRLDRLTTGLQPGNLIIIAARPAMGKTTLELNFIRNQAIDYGLPVAVFSLEMSFRELTEKLLNLETELNLRKIKSEVFSRLEFQQFSTKSTKLSNAPIYIDDSASLTISELRVRCRMLVEKYGVKAIYIDYLQLMKGDPSAKGNREQEISNISRGCKAIAKELNIPVIALSQLSRKVEERPSKKPILADLRESGSIEQDADIVILMWRPGGYNPPITSDGAGTYADGATELNFAKHRNGPPGQPFLRMIPSLSKFEQMDSPYLQKVDTVIKKEEKPLAPINTNSDDLPF